MQRVLFLINRGVLVVGKEFQLPAGLIGEERVIDPGDAFNLGPGDSMGVGALELGENRLEYMHMWITWSVEVATKSSGAICLYADLIGCLFLAPMLQLQRQP